MSFGIYQKITDSAGDQKNILCQKNWQQSKSKR